MTRAAAGMERGSLTAAGHSRSIEYATAVLTAIRADAIEGFNKLPHGGVEIGGVLFGTKDSACVKALEFRAVPCEYAYGPSYALSEKDQAGLKEQLALASADHELGGLIPVGWYHSHTRSEICLSERDLELFDRFFPEPWQIALVVRPANFSPTRAGFFFREANGKILAERSYSEFTIPAAFGASAISVVETARAPADVDRDKLAAPQAALHTGTQAEQQAGTPTERQAEMREPAEHSIQRVAWVAGACLLSVALALGGWRVWTQFRPQVFSHETAARTDPHQLRIRQLELQADLLRRKLAEQSNQNTALQQMVTELKNRPAPVIPPLIPQTEASRTGGALRTAPTKSDSKARPAATPVSSHAASSQVVKWEPKMTRLPVSQIAIAKPNHTPMLAPPSVMSAAPATSMPRMEQLPAVPAPERAGASLEKTAAAEHPVRSGPVAGRIIWTGRLQRNAWVVIEGRNVSTGSLTGELPARPVHINVYPADLTNDGLVLYSANMKYAKSATETPGQQNGWNRTLYTWNPQHSRDVAVTEAPSSANNWNRVALRANSPVSVIVIDWSLAQ